MSHVSAKLCHMCLVTDVTFFCHFRFTEQATQPDQVSTDIVDVSTPDHKEDLLPSSNETAAMPDESGQLHMKTSQSDGEDKDEYQLDSGNEEENTSCNNSSALTSPVASLAHEQQERADSIGAEERKKRGRRNKFK